MWLGVPFLNPELNWILTAERLAEGNALYAQTWTNTPPLTALVYWIIYEGFGRNALAYQTISLLLIFTQALIFNQILRNARVYLEITLLPALLYLILMGAFIDFFALTPILMANSFILIVLNYTLTQLSEKRKYNGVFEIGAYTGIATLFYLPSFLMLAIPTIAFLFYTGTKFRDYLLLAFSFAFTLIIAFLGFYMFDREYAFYLSFFQPILQFNPKFLLTIVEILSIFGLVWLLVILNFLKSPQYRRYTNYQNRCQTILNLWFIVAILTAFLDNQISAYSFTFTIPAIAFLLTHFFLQLQVVFLAELLFLAIFSLSIYFTYSTIWQTPLSFEVPFTDWGKYTLSVNTQKLISKSPPQAKLLSGRRILVLGDNKSYYLNARTSTPYLDWQISQRHFQNMDKYNILISVYQNFKRNSPEIIIDEKGIAPLLFKKIPLLGKNYRKLPNNNWYIHYKIEDDLLGKL
jgi:hypothetical protein